jgi:hypothetical protein
MKAPDTHEDLAVMMLSKWELEDELKAIEEVLADLRVTNVAHKKSVLLREGSGFGREQIRKLNESN